MTRLLPAVLVGALLLPSSVIALDDIELPPGFSIEEYADVPNARSLALGDRGTVFVANRKGQSVYAVVANDDGMGGQTALECNTDNNDDAVSVDECIHPGR